VSSPSGPIGEIRDLYDKEYKWKDLSGEEASEKLKSVTGDMLHLKMDLEIVSWINFEIQFRGNKLLNYDVGYSRFNDIPYNNDQPVNLRFTIEMLIDKTSVETYIGNGKLFISEGLKKKKTDEGLQIKGNVKIHSMEVQKVHSIW
jgi:fructan beta-fructosidase